MTLRNLMLLAPVPTSPERPHLLHQMVQIPISNLAVLSVGKAHRMRLQIHVGEEEGLVHESPKLQHLHHRS